MFWLCISVFGSMIVCIHDLEMPKVAWDTLVKLYITNNVVWKMKLKQELQRGKMSINDFKEGKTTCRLSSQLEHMLIMRTDDDLEWIWEGLCTLLDTY